jgi:hypothetical protein
MLLKLPHFQYLIQHVRREAENRIKFKGIAIYKNHSIFPFPFNVHVEKNKTFQFCSICKWKTLYIFHELIFPRFFDEIVSLI